jgi:hypothetical protein
MVEDKVFFGHKLLIGEDDLFEDFPEDHYRKPPLFHIKQETITKENGLSSVINCIETEGGSYFDEHGFGAYVLRAKNRRFIKSLESMEILDKELKYSI